MLVGDLISQLNVFHHISNTDAILVQVDVDGIRRFLNLYDMYKVQVRGRQLPVLVPGSDTVTPDQINGKVLRLPMNGDIQWMCSLCGGSVGEFDNFCKHCGKQLNDKQQEGDSDGKVAETSGQGED